MTTPPTGSASDDGESHVTHGLRVRDLTHPDQLRALAHPKRMAILDLLLTEGPMTASGCAARLGDSRAACSYHLRQLERFGFVAEAAGGVGRERPWQAVPSGNHIERGGSPAQQAAADQLIAVIDARHLERLRTFRAAERTDPWAGQGAVNDWPVRVTETELAEIRAAFDALLAPLVQRTFRGTAPAGARIVDIITQAMPRPHPHG